MEIRSDSHLYQVGDQVAEADEYRLYLCIQEDTGRQCLFQIASTTEHNGGLDRATYILKEFKRRADELETEYAKFKKDPDNLLNYDLGFPELVDSFVCHEQGNRRVNILAFRNVEDVRKMVPLIGITEKDRLRIDLRTSAWIMGKLLKLLIFAHSEGIAAGQLSGENILIEPDQHYVMIFDWANAFVNSEEIPKETRRQEISAAAQAVIVALGGDMETGVFPNDGDEAFDRYTDHLLSLARGEARSAERAHQKFYELVDELWERKYYPFTFHPLT